MASATSTVAILVLLGVAMLSASYLVVSQARKTSEIYRQRAEQQATQLRERLYASQISTAFRRVQQGALNGTRKLLDEFRNEENTKGFEWNWLEGIATSEPRELVNFRAHKDIIYSATFSPDGQTAATCGADRSIQLWDPTTGASKKVLRPVLRLDPTAGSADENCVRFSPDGRLLASGCEDGTVRLWNPTDETWKALRPGHHGEVLAVDFSSDGRWLLSASADQIVRCWDLHDSGVYTDFTGHGGPVTSAAFSPNTPEVASADKHGGIRVWNRKSREIRFQATPGGSQLCVAYSPDGSLLASGGESGTLHLWNTNSFDLAYLEKRTVGTIRSVDFSPDGKRLMCGDDEGAIVVWRIPEGDVLWHFNANQGSVWSARFSPDSQTLVTGSSDSSARIWELPSLPDTVRWIAKGERRVLHVAFSPRGSSFGLTLQDGRVLLGHAQKSGSLLALPIASADLSPPAFSPDGTQIAVVQLNGRIGRWDLNAQRELPPFEPPQITPASPIWKKYAIRLAYTAKGDLLALRCDGRMWICDGENWREQSPMCRSVAVPPLLSSLADRQAIVMYDAKESVIRFWNPDQKRAEHEIPYLSSVHLVAGCSMDGKWLAFGQGQGDITLMRSTPNSVPQLLIGHHRQITSLAFSPDGRTLASSSSDGIVRLWHVGTGQELFVLEDLHRAVHSLSFSSDGRFLAVVGDTATNGNPVAIYDSHVNPKREEARTGNSSRRTDK